MLQFVNFKKKYGPFTVLDIPELMLDSGIFWVKGINGSGKSTLLKTIAGILSFDGNLILDQTNSIKKHPVAYRKLVNFADAEPVFPEFLTGLEMIKLFSTAKAAPRHQYEYFVESMKMNDYITARIGMYSSGMLKKLSIVLAFLGKPALILLDEPLITIDKESLVILYQWIEEKYKRDKISFLVSSHQPLETNIITVTHELLVEQQTLTFIM